MAYGVNWDEASPVGATTAAADIDTEFQNLKISIRERMDNLVGSGNWTNDAVDPKKVQLSALTLSYVNAKLSSSFSLTTVASQLLTWTELLNVGGDVTVSGDTITLDTAGTYLVFFTGYCTFQVGTGVEFIPGTSVQGTFVPGGTATIHMESQSLSVHGNCPIGLSGIVVATASQTLNLDLTTVITVGTGLFLMQKMNVNILRVL